MIIKQLTRQEKLTESRKLLKNILQRTKNIERRGLTSAFYAVNSFNELRKSLPKDISVLSDKELNNLYRDLKYINNLKTSYVKGAEEVANRFAPIKEKLRAKTGTLSDTSSIAGFLTTKHGNKYAFAIIINDTTSTIPDSA